MKTTPTETDREAARVFAMSSGMRAWCRIEGAEVVARVLGKDPVTMHAHAYAESLGMHLTESLAHNFGPAAIDTDDNSTVGQMLAQVEAMRPGQAVSIVDRLHSLPGEDERRFAVLVEHDGTQTVATGPTRGAALVAARRDCA